MWQQQQQGTGAAASSLASPITQNYGATPLLGARQDSNWTTAATTAFSGTNDGNDGAVLIADLFEQQEMGWIWQLIWLLLAAVLVAFIVACIVGNVLVMLAITWERELRGRPQSYLIFSLALADLIVGVFVSPLSAWYTLTRSWNLGVAVCDAWIAVDVLVCTASILHLVAIALDRYWSVTDVSYSQQRTPRRVVSMLCAVWLLSLLISLAPLAGWKDAAFVERVQRLHVCLISQQISYQVFSTSTAFYIPLVAIIVVYYKIMRAAKKRFKRERDRRKTALAKTAAAATSAVAVSAVTAGRASPGVGGIGLLRKDDEREHRGDAHHIELGAVSKKRLLANENNDNDNDDDVAVMVVRVNEDEYDFGDEEEEEEEEDGSSCEKKRKRSAVENSSSNNAESNNHQAQGRGGNGHTNGAIDFDLSSQKGRPGTKAVVAARKPQERAMLPKGQQVPQRQSQQQPQQQHDNFEKMHSKDSTRSTASRGGPLAGFGRRRPRRSKESAEHRRERKAWRTLAIITGSFVACWLPFFLVSLYRPFCKCSIPPLLESTTNWLGYLNSALNPIIYSVFSMDFRNAFARILKRLFRLHRLQR